MRTILVPCPGTYLPICWLPDLPTYLPVRVIDSGENENNLLMNEWKGEWITVIS